MACTMILFGSSRHRNGKISGNVAAGFVYSGLQSMAAEGAGAAAAAKAVGGLLGVWGFLAARVRGEDDADGEKGEMSARCRWMSTGLRSLFAYNVQKSISTQAHTAPRDDQQSLLPSRGQAATLGRGCIF